VPGLVLRVGDEEISFVLQVGSQGSTTKFAGRESRYHHEVCRSGVKVAPRSLQVGNQGSTLVLQVLPEGENDGE